MKFSEDFSIFINVQYGCVLTCQVRSSLAGQELRKLGIQEKVVSSWVECPLPTCFFSLPVYHEMVLILLPNIFRVKCLPVSAPFVVFYPNKYYITCPDSNDPPLALHSGFQKL